MNEKANREENETDVDVDGLREEERLHAEHTPQPQSLGSTFRQFLGVLSASLRDCSAC